VIRRATPQDYPWIRAVAAEVYVALGDYGTIIGSWLDHPGVLTYVEEDDERGVKVRRGFTLLGFYEPDSGEDGRPIADLLAIAVAPRYQRRGIGSRLLEHAIQVAAAVGASRKVDEMRLTVADTNPVGQRLFSRFGFRVLDDHHGTYDGGQRAIRMGLSLRRPEEARAR
jgi:ribosomal protein S18 acetylase RimI-like enzyme